MPTLALTHGSKLEVAINIVQNAKLFTDTLCGAFLIFPFKGLYRVQVVHIRGKGKIEQERNLSS